MFDKDGIDHAESILDRVERELEELAAEGVDSMDVPPDNWLFSHEVYVLYHYIEYLRNA